MKFLLAAVNAKYIHSNSAVYSLKAYAGKELEQYIEIAEYTINNRAEQILADIYERRPDVIGFSCYIWNYRLIEELLVDLHKLMPTLPIWLGGPEVTFDAAEIMAEYPMLSGIMVGEGEAAFRELVWYYLEQSGETGKHRVSSLKSIAGLCLKNGFTPARDLMNLNSLPFPYEDLSEFENRIIYYESGRGCPYRCSYCLSSIDKMVRLRDIDTVKKELQFFLDRLVPQVKFIDRTFNCMHQHAQEIWQYILEHDNGVTNFHFEIAADILTDCEIALLRRMRPGLIQLEIGVQSVNPGTLETIHRTMNLEKVKQVVGEIRKGNNIHQHLDLIAGLPHEDYKSLRNSFNVAYAMKPNQLQLGFLKVLKGSEMHDRAKEYGICHMEKPPYEILYTGWLSYPEVQKLKKVEEMVELYYNSGQYSHVLPFLEKAFEDPFQMFEAMAAYFELKKYFWNSPSRAFRYEILLNFALEYNRENAEVYKELFIYDMYLRENLKSRPGFAKDLSLYRDVLQKKYREAQSKDLLLGYEDYESRQIRKMTHMEPFCYPVWDMSRWKGEADGNIRFYLLFDYKQRSPLWYEARTAVLAEDGEST